MTIHSLIGPNGRLPILIRDDDINFFTKTEMLESIYSEAWNSGFKVSLSVIPSQSGINDLCVPPQQRKTGLSYSITDNHSLIKCLKGKVVKGSVEILQHGLHHTYNELRRGEFSGTRQSTNSILHGRDIIEDAFGTQPKFFVPPGEDISNENLQLILKLGMIPIFRNTIFDRFLRLKLFPNLIKKISFRLIMGIYAKVYLEQSILSLMKPVILSPVEGFIKWSLPSSNIKNFKTNAGLLRLSRDIINSCSISRTPLCILNHYHSYFYDWNSTITKNELFRTWIEVMRSFRDVEFGWKVDFMNLYERFMKVKKVRTNQTGSKITIKSEEEIMDYSFLSPSPIEQNSIAEYNKDTSICTIKNILPESQITIYLKE
jgi:Uncharacterized protein conserved in bacteria (DUF2334)